MDTRERGTATGRFAKVRPPRPHMTAHSPFGAPGPDPSAPLLNTLESADPAAPSTRAAGWLTLRAWLLRRPRARAPPGWTTTTLRLLRRLRRPGSVAAAAVVMGRSSEVPRPCGETGDEGGTAGGAAALEKADEPLAFSDRVCPPGAAAPVAEHECGLVDLRRLSELGGVESGVRVFPGVSSCRIAPPAAATVAGRFDVDPLVCDCDTVVVESLGRRELRKGR